MRTPSKAKIQAGAVFVKLDLRYYEWEWVEPLEIIEIRFGGGPRRFVVQKWEDRTVVLTPLKQEVEG